MLLTLTPALPFTFSAPSPLSTPLTFSPAPSTSSTFPLKRPRPAHDVDDSPSFSRKKRRLRLLLITSRLSHPFSTPASHIVNRGSSKVAVWPRQKNLGTDRLRKIAIMNSVRRSVVRSSNHGPFASAVASSPLPTSIFPWIDSAKAVADDARNIGGGESEFEEVNATLPSTSLPVTRAGSEGESSAARLGSFEEYKTSHLVAQPSFITPVEHPPIPPSPLGLSNYDAFDEEDSYPGYCIPHDDSDEEDDYLPHPDWAPHPCGKPLIQLPPSPSPSPSPSPPKSESVEQVAPTVAKEPVVSPNFAAAHVAWRPLEDRRPPSPPDEKLLRVFRLR